MGSALNVPVWHCRSTGGNFIDNRTGDKPRRNCHKKNKGGLPWQKEWKFTNVMCAET